jgi:hypothetical protein
MQSALTTAQTRFHRYRISVIETWPEDATRQSVLAAARAALNRELTYERARPRAESRDLSQVISEGANGYFI